MEPILTLENIRLQRGDFCLRGGHLALQAGQLYPLLGKNGAGKSTLLQLLALLRRPQAGSVSFAGEVLRWRHSILHRLRQQITLVDQQPLLFQGTVEQNLLFGLQARGCKGTEQRRRLGQILETVGLSEFANRSAQELSGGEAKRVALARALIIQPSLLLLDEPTTNLDAEQRQIMERILKELPEQGICLVVATHDLKQSERLGGMIIRMQRGTILTVAQSDHLVKARSGNQQSNV